MDIDYDLRKGDFHLSVKAVIPMTGITGVFGASGAGKTTLLRCIAGLDDIGESGIPVHRRRIATVFQKAELFAHLNVRQNIEYAERRASEPGLAVDDAVEMLDLRGLLSRKPMTLSGGEAQRVAIARALCQSPRLMLMDEPLAGLDETRKHELMGYLEKIHAQTQLPIVYVSHQIDEICRLCDHLLVLDSGSLVACGDLRTTLTRLDVPQLSGAIAGSVLHALAAAYDEKDDLTVFQFAGGEVHVPGEYSHGEHRLRIAANDVSVAVSRSTSSSILNILPAYIDAVEVEGRATRLLRLTLGDDVLLARITGRSWQQLGLQIGAEVYAQIKSVTVRR